MKEYKIEQYLQVQTEDDVIQAMDYSVHLAKRIGFLPNEQILLRLVTEEAIVNALEYGTFGDMSDVEVNWTIAEQFLLISVKQKGPLFKIEKDDEINYHSRGRGLQLISHIMDHVSVTQDGHFVILQMKKSLRSGGIHS